MQCSFIKISVSTVVLLCITALNKSYASDTDPADKATQASTTTLSKDGAAKDDSDTVKAAPQFPIKVFGYGYNGLTKLSVEDSLALERTRKHIQDQSKS